MSQKPTQPPETKDPGRVITGDGTTWTLRAVTLGGRGLYAPEAVTDCPRWVLATLTDLAEHRVRTADDTPVPYALTEQAETELHAERNARALCRLLAPTPAIEGGAR